MFPSASVCEAASGEGWRTGPGDSLELFPRRRTAVLWDNVYADGRTLDPASMHSGQPVIKGCKWVLTVWFYGAIGS